MIKNGARNLMYVIPSWVLNKIFRISFEDNNIVMLAFNPYIRVRIMIFLNILLTFGLLFMFLDISGSKEVLNAPNRNVGTIRSPIT